MDGTCCHRATLKQLPENNHATPSEFFGIPERLFVIRLPDDSVLDGKTLAQSRLGAALGLNVLAILGSGSNRLAPAPTAILNRGDRLLVEGRLDRLNELRGGDIMMLENDQLEIEELLSAEIGLVELTFSPQSSLPGQTLGQLDFRNRYGAVVLAVRRGGGVVRTNLENLTLHQDDILLVQGTQDQLDGLQTYADFNVSDPEDLKQYHLEERLKIMRLPPDSALVGKKLRESHLGDAFGLGVMGIIREGNIDLIPDPDEAACCRGFADG